MSSPRKFRVWDGEEMHEPPHDYVLAGDGDLLFCLPELEKFGAEKHGDDVTLGIADDDHVVMQYTGITDAEGTEVYAGDVLETIWNGGMQGVVVYEEGAWALRYDQFSSDLISDAVSDPMSHKYGGRATVVGNQYEDPSLLESNTD